VPKSLPRKRSERSPRRQPPPDGRLVPLINYPGYYCSFHRRNLPRFWSDWSPRGILSKEFRHEIFPSVCESIKYPRLGMKNRSGIMATALVHVLVMEAWTGISCPKNLETRHLDGSRDNYHPSNLKRGTRSENGMDRLRHGTDIRGTRHPNNLLSEEQVYEIFRLLDAGYRPTVVSRITGIKRSNIYNIKSGSTWGWLRARK